MLNTIKEWHLAAGADWVKEDKRLRKHLMNRFAYEEDIDNFNSLSEDKCSYENADKFLKWLKPLHTLAKTELEDGNVTEIPEVDNVDYDEVLTESDKQKIDEITHTQEAI